MASRPQRWAQAGDWATHREILTDMYGRQGMTLNKVKEFMEREHGFHATARMYKSNFQKWGLQKNLRFGEVSKLILQGAAGPAVAPVPADLLGGKRVNERRLKRYIKQLPKHKYHELAKIGSERPDGSHIVPARSAWDISCRAPSPKEIYSALFSLESPADLRMMEQCKRVMRDYVAGACDSKMWTLHADQVVRTDSTSEKVWELGFFPFALLQQGKTRQAFRAMQAFFDRCRAALAEQPPLLFGYIYLLAFLYSRQYVDLSQALIRYVRDLLHIMYPASHPLRVLADSMYRLGATRLKGFSRPILEGYIEAFQYETGADSVASAHIVKLVYPKLAYEGLMDWRVAESAIKKALARVEEVCGRSDLDMIIEPKTTIAWMYIKQKRWSEARQIIDEVLAEPAISPLTRAGSLRDMREIAQNDGTHEEKLLAHERLIRFNREAFGLNDNKTGDALVQLETYLRSVGDVEAADRVQHDLEALMDELCGNVGELKL